MCRSPASTRTPGSRSWSTSPRPWKRTSDRRGGTERDRGRRDRQPMGGRRDSQPSGRSACAESTGGAWGGRRAERGPVSPPATPVDGRICGLEPDQRTLLFRRPQVQVRAPASERAGEPGRPAGLVRVLRDSQHCAQRSPVPRYPLRGCRFTAALLSRSSHRPMSRRAATRTQVVSSTVPSVSQRRETTAMDGWSSRDRSQLVSGSWAARPLIGKSANGMPPGRDANEQRVCTATGDGSIHGTTTK